MSIGEKTGIISEDRFSSCQGIAPANAGEAREVRIRGDEFATVLDGQRSEVRVGDKVRDSLPLTQQLLEDGPVPVGRLHSWSIQLCMRESA